MLAVGWLELLHDILLNLHTANLGEIKLFVTYFGGKRNNGHVNVSQVNDLSFGAI